MNLGEESLARNNYKVEELPEAFRRVVGEHDFIPPKLKSWDSRSNFERQGWRSKDLWMSPTFVEKGYWWCDTLTLDLLSGLKNFNSITTR